AFPPAADVARFIAACMRAVEPFKATAGLHHALRADYPLTYEPGCAAAKIFGFINVFVAAAVAAAGAPARELERVLEAGSASEMRFDDEGLAWRAGRVATARAARVRERGLLSLGS